MDSNTHTKENIRARFRAELRCLSPAFRQQASTQLCEALHNFLMRQAARTAPLMPAIWGFRPLADEPCLDPLWQKLLSDGWQVAFPRVEGTALGFYPVESLEAGWRKGAFGIREPDSRHTHRLVPCQGHIILIPGLAFDANNYRLGRGGGYYDRFLAGSGAALLKLGVAFSFQLVPALPLDAHDVAMDRVIGAG